MPKLPKRKDKFMEDIHNSIVENNPTNTLSRNVRFADVVETGYLDLCNQDDLNCAAPIRSIAINTKSNR